MFRTIVKKFIPKKILDELSILLPLHSLRSYSQEGEDVILRRIFENQNTGFYIDVGAHHPMKYSNTYLFYKRGWHGINLDAMPGSMKAFKRIRKRDINLEEPISTENKKLTYYVFDEPALNSFDSELSNQRNDSDDNCHIIKTLELQTRQLSDVLDEYLPYGQEVDFLSIDVEGFDMDVLQSNDWNKYRPKVILVEILSSSLSELESSDITQFLRKHGYDVYAKSANTVIFKIIS